jgi:hypothetical protein
MKSIFYDTDNINVQCAKETALCYRLALFKKKSHYILSFKNLKHSYYNLPIFKLTYSNRINKWDKMFFGKGENEAKSMDPQQRLVLECVYKAMEDGGITKAHLDKSETGVYIGKFLTKNN